MHLLKQSTAATVIVGPVLDSAGAAVTTAVVGDFRLAKEGTSAVLSGATVTHDANGYYLVALTTTNTNTVGRLAIYSNNTAQSMGTTRFMVLLPSVYDALVTNAVNTSGGLPSATGSITALAGAISTFAGGAVASVTGAVGSISGVTFPTNLGVLQINSSGHVSRVTLVDTTTTNSDMRGTDNALLAASYTTPPTAAANASAVRTELATELGRIDATISSRLATASYTAAPTAAAVADAVWDETMSDHTTSTSYGGRIIRAANSNVTAQLTGSNHMACDVHAFQADVIDAAAIAASAVTELQAGLATATTQTTILDRLGAFTGSGVNTVLGFLKALGSKAATTPSDMGGTYSASTDATEAIRDAMQAGTGDASQTTLLAVQATVDAVAASLSGSAVEVVSRVADGGSLTLYAGDDMRVRSGTEVAVSVTDVGGAIYSRLNTIGTANLRFGAARPTQPAGAITGSVASLAAVGSGASQLVRVVIEIDDAGQSLAAADNYVWQLVSSRAQGSQYDTYTEMEGVLTVKRRVAVPVFS